ncbi:MAG: hypothetical protein SVM80_03195 [Halobacteriota archaeon]|nr:hypothetical protein [Halobacteriota archaeon]
MKELGAIDAIKRSLIILMDDPGIIVLYALPTIVILIFRLHLKVIAWRSMTGDTIDFARIPTVTSTLPLFLIYGIIWLVVGVVAIAGIILKIDANGSDSHIGLEDAFSKGVRYFIPLFVSSIIAVLLISFGLILMVIPGIYFSLKLTLFAPACVLEPENKRSIRRSWELTRGRILNIFIIVALIEVIAVIIGVVLPFVGSIMTTLIAIQFLVIPMTLIYLDARKRETSERAKSEED